MRRHIESGCLVAGTNERGREEAAGAAAEVQVRFVGYLFSLYSKSLADRNLEARGWTQRWFRCRELQGVRKSLRDTALALKVELQCRGAGYKPTENISDSSAGTSFHHPDSAERRRAPSRLLLSAFLAGRPTINLATWRQHEAR